VNRRRQLLALAIAMASALAVFLLWPDAPAPEPGAHARPATKASEPRPALPQRAEPSEETEEDDALTGTIPTGDRSFRRSFSVRVQDEAGAPIAGATISTFEPQASPLCHSDGNGRCDFTTTADCRTCDLLFAAAAPGFGDAEVWLEGMGELVELPAARTVTATVVAPSDALLSALTLRVTVDAPSLLRSVEVDHAGTYPLTALPRMPVVVALMDHRRPLEKVTLPVDVDTVSFTLTPRRLDVQIETDDVQGTEDCRVVDLRCPGTSRLLQSVDVIGGHVLHARFEYAPEGPCTVALSDTCDRGMTTDARATATGVSPPTAIVLHRER
jgi:hypothetical protein